MLNGPPVMLTISEKAWRRDWIVYIFLKAIEEVYAQDPKVYASWNQLPFGSPYRTTFVGH